MRLIEPILIVAALIGLSPTPQTALAAPSRASRAEEVPVDPVALDAVADFLVPRALYLKMNLIFSDGDYRTRLSRIEGFAKLETEMPGLTEHMTAAVTAHCQETIAPLIQVEWNRARQRARQAFSAQELRKLVRLLSPTVAELSEIEVDFRTGGTATEAVQSIAVRIDSAMARLDPRVRAFVRHPSNTSTADKLITLQTEAGARLKELPKSMAPYLIEAMRRGDMAGNAFASQRGHPPIFEPS